MDGWHGLYNIYILQSNAYSWMPSLTPMPVAVSSESPVTILISTPALFNAEIDSRMPRINEDFDEITVHHVGIRHVSLNIKMGLDVYRFVEDP